MTCRLNLINSRARLSNTEFMHTLKELADIGAKASLQHITGTYAAMAVSDRSSAWERERPAREAFTKAILDAIGYEFPKDEEREAFDAWWKDNKIAYVNENDAFKAWKAGREELRKSQSLDKQPSYSMPPSYAGITLLGATPNEPEWILWNGGECPLSDKVKKWEYKVQNGAPFMTEYKPFTYRWWHSDQPFHREDNIIAYRVWE